MGYEKIEIRTIKGRGSTKVARLSTISRTFDGGKRLAPERASETQMGQEMEIQDKTQRDTGLVTKERSVGGKRREKKVGRVGVNIKHMKGTWAGRTQGEGRMAIYASHAMAWLY